MRCRISLERSINSGFMTTPVLRAGLSEKNLKANVRFIGRIGMASYSVATFRSGFCSDDNKTTPDLESGQLPEMVHWQPGGPAGF